MSGKCEMSWVHSFFLEWVWEEYTHFFISEKWEWEHSQNLWAVTGLPKSYDTCLCLHFFGNNLKLLTVIYCQIISSICLDYDCHDIFDGPMECIGTSKSSNSILKEVYRFVEDGLNIELWMNDIFYYVLHLKLQGKNPWRRIIFYVECDS